MPMASRALPGPSSSTTIGVGSGEAVGVGAEVTRGVAVIRGVSVMRGVAVTRMTRTSEKDE